MKKLGSILSIAAVTGLAFACSNAPEADTQANDAKEVEVLETASAVTYNVEAATSDIRWVGFNTYGDNAHTGKIMMSEGSLSVEDDKVVGGNFVIDMATISNEDLPVEGQFNQAKLIGHLSSPDFFNVAEYPTSSFTVTSVEIAPADHEQGITHMLSGNLEMRGNSKNITVPATIKMMDGKLTLNTPEFVIDRTQWEVEALSTTIVGLAKENLVDDNIKLQIELTASRS